MLCSKLPALWHKRARGEAAQMAKAIDIIFDRDWNNGNICNYRQNNTVPIFVTVRPFS